MRQSVTSIAQGMVLTAKQSKHIAESIGKPYPTMMRELNPYDHSAKLGAETLLEIMKVTNNVEALQYMAHELGYSLSPDTNASLELSSMANMAGMAPTMTSELAAQAPPSAPAVSPINSTPIVAGMADIASMMPSLQKS